MNNKIMILAVLTTVFFPNAASAADEPKREGPHGRKVALQQDGAGRREMFGAIAQRMPLMMALDADKDGTISPTELENATKSLSTLDKDGDGALSSEELRPDISAPAKEGKLRDALPGSDGPRSKEMLARIFEQRDADTDGKLTGDEIPERMRENLARVDKNSDGSIDKDELEQAMAKMGDRAGKLRGAKSDDGGAGVTPKRPPTE